MRWYGESGEACRSLEVMVCQKERHDAASLVAMISCAQMYLVGDNSRGSHGGRGAGSGDAAASARSRRAKRAVAG